MSEKLKTRISLILSIVLGLLFLMSAMVKLSNGEQTQEQIAHLGTTLATVQILAIIEIIAVVLLLIPKTKIIGALLLIAYSGGIIATHLLKGESVIMGILIQALLWVVLYLNNVKVLRLAKA